MCDFFMGSTFDLLLTSPGVIKMQESRKIKKKLWKKSRKLGKNQFSFKSKMDESRVLWRRRQKKANN